LTGKRKDYVIYGEDEYPAIRAAARAAAMAVDDLAAMVRPGMTTKELDNMAAAVISSTGGESAFLGYHGYPGQICVSVNDEVVHGIGSFDRVLSRGDVVSLDVGVLLEGFIGDNATTVVVGGVEPPPDVARLLKGTRKALDRGISAAVPGNRVGDISSAVEAAAKQFGLGVVREYVGHACGRELHEPPEIPNFTSRHKGPLLRSGMVLAIEPMLNLGKRHVVTDKDGWTVRTRDGSVSAHFEHMVLVTSKEPEILTWRKTL